VSQASTASDLVQISAILCAATALGCGSVARWIVASPMLGVAGGLLVVSVVLCAVGFAAFVCDWRARDRRAPAPPRSLTSGFADDARLAGGTSLFRQKPVLTLAAALLAGVFLGGEY
jgi:hypothetical protein